MKLKDIGKYINEKNKLNKFLNNGKVTEIEISGGFGNAVIADNVEKLIAEFEQKYYGDLSKDTNLLNEDGYITFKVYWTDCNGKDNSEKYYLYISEREEAR